MANTSSWWHICACGRSLRGAASHLLTRGVLFGPLVSSGFGVVSSGPGSGFRFRFPVFRSLGFSVFRSGLRFRLQVAGDPFRVLFRFPGSGSRFRSVSRCRFRFRSSFQSGFRSWFAVCGLHSCATWLFSGFWWCGGVFIWVRGVNAVLGVLRAV